MDIVQALIWLVIIVVAIAIVYWALASAPIPPPFRWIVNVVLAIIALVLLFEYVVPMIGLTGSGHRLR